MVRTLRPLFCCQDSGLLCAVTDFARMVATSKDGTGIMMELVKRVIPEENSLPVRLAMFQKELASSSKTSSKYCAPVIRTAKDTAQEQDEATDKYAAGSQASPPVDIEVVKPYTGKQDATWSRLRVKRCVQRQWVSLEIQVPIRAGTHRKTHTSRYWVLECVHDKLLQRQQSQTPDQQTHGDKRSSDGWGPPHPKTSLHREWVAEEEEILGEAECEQSRKPFPLAEMTILNNQEKAPTEGAGPMVGTAQELSAAQMRRKDTKWRGKYFADDSFSAVQLIGSKNTGIQHRVIRYYGPKKAEEFPGDGGEQAERGRYRNERNDRKEQQAAVLLAPSAVRPLAETTYATAGTKHITKSWRLLRMKHPLHQVWVAAEGELRARTGKLWKTFPVMQLMELRNLEEDQDARNNAAGVSQTEALPAVALERAQAHKCSSSGGTTYPDDSLRLKETAIVPEQTSGTQNRGLVASEEAEIIESENAPARMQQVNKQVSIIADAYTPTPALCTDGELLCQESTDLKDALVTCQRHQCLGPSTSTASSYRSSEGDIEARISTLRLVATVEANCPEALSELVKLPHGGLISLFFGTFAPDSSAIPPIQGKQCTRADGCRDHTTYIGLYTDSEALPQRTRKNNLEAVLDFLVALCKDEGIRQSLVEKGLVLFVGNFLSAMLEKRFPLVHASGDASGSICTPNETPAECRDWVWPLQPRTVPDRLTTGQGFLLIQALQGKEEAKEQKVGLMRRRIRGISAPADGVYPPCHAIVLMKMLVLEQSWNQPYFTRALFPHKSAENSETDVAVFDSCRRQAVALLSALCLPAQGKQQCASCLLPLVTALCFLETDPSSLAQVSKTYMEPRRLCGPPIKDCIAWLFRRWQGIYFVLILKKYTK
ncbi:hypothetical protein NCLIV_027110 [Neospora caninum Liverpool]|uniref:Uncharacterized protein n=1 Tax=Neospora caninum (strain Liverpool) TaxID=572307 RepID=F0VGS9_NEOCL|nr:hypothetical protein NCLIV_027110 [Neospora caninum Liverpool]CBZ52923.1 hypothetical protein NCLIV_027110 [Neospora caninum Liverpool]CEL66905.1 TPA: hypothetical protein BN1204_027110 [Neospora caninum Liverpool]|eukprot:XP_003882955.1 hypothetical protein NCLIV_027110 [Neospora caninum Liverpool]